MTNQLHDGAAYDPFLPARWTDIAQVPSGLRTRLGTPVTRALFRAAVRDLPVRVEYPDGTVQGAAGAVAHAGHGQPPAKTLGEPWATLLPQATGSPTRPNTSSRTAVRRFGFCTASSGTRS